VPGLNEDRNEREVLCLVVSREVKGMKMEKRIKERDKERVGRCGWERVREGGLADVGIDETETVNL
jgi:hypothetical protein